MAENTEKKVLIDIEIKAKEALKNYAELKIKADELRAAQKELDASTEDGRIQFEGLGQQLKARLSLATAEYNKMSEAERNGVKGDVYKKSIQDTTAELKKLEEELGNHRRSVGDYAKAGQDMKKEMKELANSLAAMKAAGEEGSEQFKEMTARLAELNDAFSDVKGGAKELASDTSNLDALSQSLGAAIGAMGAYTAAMGLSADEEKEYVVTKAVAAAQWLWNAALAANPVILIAVAVAALTVGIRALTKALSASAKAEKEATKAAEAYELQQQRTAAAIDTISNKTTNAVNERNNKLREEILEMKKNGATAEHIANLKRISTSHTGRTAGSNRPQPQVRRSRPASRR
jgi:chromosome segregation ATPase